MDERRYWDERIETLGRDELALLQGGRLQWQVQRCYDGSAFYRERMDQAGVRPDDIASPDDLRRLPLVTWAELRDEQRAHPPFGRFIVAPRPNWREAHRSTRPDGQALNVLWSEADVHNLTSLAARTLWQLGARQADVLLIALDYGVSGIGLVVHYGAAKLGSAVVPVDPEAIDAQIGHLRWTGASALLASSSNALRLTEALAARGVGPSELPLRFGGFGGAPSASEPSTRRTIEAGLGVDAFECYGLADAAPTLAAECQAKAGLHWAEDHVLVEVLHPETREPVSEGEDGVLVFTQLIRQATPLVRYWSDTRARLITGTCECGRTLARSPGGVAGGAHLDSRE